MHHVRDNIRFVFLIFKESIAVNIKYYDSAHARILSLSLFLDLCNYTMKNNTAIKKTE